MNKYIVVKCAFATRENVDLVVNKLLEERLISCAQISNIESLYYWKDNLEHTNEFLVTMRSKKALFNDIEKVIKEYHDYEVPEILALDIVEGSSEYLNWIETETKEI